MPKLHIINQYIYPDGSPVCLITEQIGNHLHHSDFEIVLVGGSGEYRSSIRPKPVANIVYLKTKIYKRNNIIQILLEYLVVFRAFWKYIRLNVNENDAVLLTSSPFTNVILRRAIKAKNVTTFFGIFDYFPASLITLGYPKFLYSISKMLYNFELKKFDFVIKASYNVGYFEKNSTVIRLWNMIDIEPDLNRIPEKKALYTGNLGIAHDVESLVKTCEKLQDQGFEINIHADGPGLEKLPKWLKLRSKGIFKSIEDLKDALFSHEIHLITGTPGTDEASFPSKIWNSMAAGREIIASGFEGKMNTELEFILKSDYKKHLSEWAEFLVAKSGILKLKKQQDENDS